MTAENGPVEIAKATHMYTKQHGIQQVSYFCFLDTLICYVSHRDVSCMFIVISGCDQGETRKEASHRRERGGNGEETGVAARHGGITIGWRNIGGREKFEFS